MTDSFADHLEQALLGVDAHDKVAALAWLRSAARTLPGGPNPLWVPLRTVECAVEISRWDDARRHLGYLLSTC